MKSGNTVQKHGFSLVFVARQKAAREQLNKLFIAAPCSVRCVKSAKDIAKYVKKRGLYVLLAARISRDGTLYFAGQAVEKICSKNGLKK